MTDSAIVTWDGGRLAVNLTFAPLLEVAGLTTVAAFMEFDGGEVAKSAVVDRRTDRIQLTGQGDEFVGFLKRHRRPRWSEYLKACFEVDSAHSGSPRGMGGDLAVSRGGVADNDAGGLWRRSRRVVRPH